MYGPASDHVDIIARLGVGIAPECLPPEFFQREDGSDDAEF
jgi:hypothetical protein